MAFTASLIVNTVVGNQRMQMYKVTADANSGSVSTGLNFINGVALTVHSAGTNGQNIKANLSAASATANGTLMMSSCANGEVFYVQVWGR